MPDVNNGISDVTLMSHFLNTELSKIAFSLDGEIPIQSLFSIFTLRFSRKDVESTSEDRTTSSWLTYWNKLIVVYSPFAILRRKSLIVDCITETGINFRAFSGGKSILAWQKWHATIISWSFDRSPQLHEIYLHLQSWQTFDWNLPFLVDRFPSWNGFRWGGWNCISDELAALDGPWSQTSSSEIISCKA